MHSELSDAFDATQLTYAYGDTMLQLTPETLMVGMAVLRDTLDYVQLMDVTAVDYAHYQCGDWATDSADNNGYGRAQHPLARSVVCAYRFAVVYQLLSLQRRARLRVKVYLPEDAPTIASVSTLWKSALWAEREVFDLFGITFIGHPDLRRIVTDDGFVGHPLRKDFPVSGTYEVRYDAQSAMVCREPTQHFARIDIPKIIRYKESQDG